MVDATDGLRCVEPVGWNHSQPGFVVRVMFPAAQFDPEQTAGQSLQDMAHGSMHSVFAGGGKAYFWPEFLGQLQIDPARRDVDQFAVMIQRQVVAQLGFEFLKALGVGVENNGEGAAAVEFVEKSGHRGAERGSRLRK